MKFNCFTYLVIILFVAFLIYAAAGVTGLILFIIMLLVPIVWQYYNGPKKQK